MLDPHDLPTIKAALRIAASLIGHDRTPYIETLLRIIDHDTVAEVRDSRHTARTARLNRRGQGKTNAANHSHATGEMRIRDAASGIQSQQVPDERSC